MANFISKITPLNSTTTYQIKDAIAQETIVGTKAQNSNIWTGTSSVIPELYNGLTIRYYINAAASGNAVLRLTLANGTTTSDIPIYHRNNDRLTSHYAVGSVVTLTYFAAGAISINGAATTADRWIATPYYDTNSNTIPSAYCDTKNSTAAKAASCTNYTLTANTYLHLILVNANTSAGALTLNVNGKGAKPIYINGTASSASNYTLPAGSYITFYDGTAYQIRTDGLLPGTGIVGSASYASSAGFANYAGTATYALNANESNHASSAGYAASALTASYAMTANYALSAGSSTTALYAITSAYAITAFNAVTAGNAKSALTASYAVTAGHAASALTASHAVTAGNAKSALTANYSVTSAMANLSSGLKSLGRQASADLYMGDSSNQSKITTMLASSSMTTGKPTNGDGYILNFGWDSAAGWGAQFAINHGTANSAMIRGAAGVSNSSKWGDWHYLLDTSNYNNYVPSKTGTGATGNWSIIANTANYAGTAARAITAFYSVTAGQAVTAAYAGTAARAITAFYSVTAGQAITAAYAVTASKAITAFNAVTAGQAITAAYAVTAAYSIDGAHASSATYANFAANGIEYIIGTQTAATNLWTGRTTDNSLYSGKMIAYKLPYAGNSSAATLNLTFADNTTSGAKAVILNQNTAVTTHFPVTSIVFLVYDATYNSNAGAWKTFDYNTNSDTKVRQTLTSADTNRPILLGYSAITTTTGNVDNVSYRNNAIYANPSTGVITAVGFSGVATEAVSAQFASTAQYALGAGTATFAATANYASSATYASTAGSATDNTKVAKAGDTMTGGLVMAHSNGGAQNVQFTYGTTIDYWWGVGSANENHGLYDAKTSKWILAASASNAWTLFGLASSANYAAKANTANYAVTANFARGAGTAQYATTAYYTVTAQFARGAGTAQFATSANFALTAAYAVTAQFARGAGTAQYATTAYYAITANFALSANSATTALYAVTAAYAMAVAGADKLGTADVGDMLQPIYLDGGAPVASSGKDIPFIVGTGSTAGTWLGTLTGLSAYYDGLLILYKPSVAGASTTTLNISNGTTNLGAKTVYLNNTTKLTTHYPANQPILLVYSTSQNSGCWVAIDNYDSNSDTKVRQTLNSGNENRPLLMAYSANTVTTANVDNVTYRNNSIFANASTGKITANGFIGNLTGNADTATALTSSAGSTTQPIFFANGAPTATSYTLAASINSGTSGTMAYYSGANAISSAAHILYYNDIDVTVQNAAKKRNGMYIYGSTYGNTATDLQSNTKGVMRFEDGGPRIQFSAAASGGTDDAALLFTNHDQAGSGSSLHFVGQQGSDNQGGNLHVTAPNLVARKRLAIGSNFVNSSYVLHVTGASYMSDSLTFNTAASKALINNTYSSTVYPTIKNHNNGNISMSASSKGLYMGYENTEHMDWLNGKMFMHGTTGNLGIGTTAPGARLHVNGGIVQITNNSNTVSIGSQNASYCHIYNSANIPFIVNKDVLVTDKHNLGNTTYPWGNLYLGGTTAAIYYQGTKSNQAMIQMIDNDSNTEGNGIRIGGGGLVIVGAGESAANLHTALGATDGHASSENLYLASDASMHLEANCNTIANRKGWRIDMSGNLIPEAAESNSFWQQNIGEGTGQVDTIYARYLRGEARSLRTATCGTAGGASAVEYTRVFNCPLDTTTCGTLATDQSCYLQFVLLVSTGYNGYTNTFQALLDLRCKITKTETGYSVNAYKYSVPWREGYSGAGNFYYKLSSGLNIYAWRNTDMLPYYSQLLTAIRYNADGSITELDDFRMFDTTEALSSTTDTTTFTSAGYVEYADWTQVVHGISYTTSTYARYILTTSTAPSTTANSATSGIKPIIKSSKAYIYGDGNIHGANLYSDSIISGVSVQASGGVYVSKTSTVGSAYYDMYGQQGSNMMWDLIRCAGSATAQGYTRLSLGNNVASGATNNAVGNLYLYGPGTGAAYLNGAMGALNGTTRTYVSTGYMKGTQIWGAVWNDYAEFREVKEKIEPGRCVIETGKGDLILAVKRMQPGAEIVSDTFGFAIGQTEKSNTPIATTGRVLAYPYEDRELFRQNIGHPVCSGPNGTVSLMTDEEYAQKGYCAIGTVSEIPDYEKWQVGETQAQNDIEEFEPQYIDVNGRIWIRIR